MQQLLQGRTIQVGEFRVQELLPAGPMENPFLLFHHGYTQVPPGTNHRTAGVGPHPHKGFSAVTFIYEGGVLHQDSTGNYEEVGAGGVQWTDAASGIVHSERPPEWLALQGGLMELLQVWINSPASAKELPPRYLAFEDASLPRLNLPEDSGYWQIVSGELHGVFGPVSTHTPLLTAMGRLHQGTGFATHLPEGWNSIFYVLSGEVTVNGQLVQAKQMLRFGGGTLELFAGRNAAVFLGSGAPLEEPIAAQGPFVMNDRKELQAAFAQYQLGSMGILTER